MQPFKFWNPVIQHESSLLQHFDEESVTHLSEELGSTFEDVKYSHFSHILL